MTERERIARIIDPSAWDQWERWEPLLPEGNFNVPAKAIREVQEEVHRALAKADAILARPDEGEAVAKDRAQVKAGDELWIKAVATDPCTSCMGVRIDTIFDKPLSTCVAPQNWSLAHPPRSPEPWRAPEGFAMTDRPRSLGPA